MLQGADSQPKPSQPKPKTLNEAYGFILNERKTAFYAKELEGDETPPPIKGLENLGAVDEPERIKRTITSLSVLPVLKRAMKDSGWGVIKGVDEDKVARDFVVAGVSGPDLEQIVNNKDVLTQFVATATLTPTIFNMADVIAADIKTKLPEVAADADSLKRIFKHLYFEEGTIAGTAVGKGEVAICVFTNCVKGTTGDLATPEGKTIEVKGRGGRLGPAIYSNLQTAKQLVNFYQTRKQGGTSNLNRKLTIERIKIRKFSTEELETTDLYDKLFTDKLKHSLNELADNIENPTKFYALANKIAQTKMRDADSAYNDFNQKGFLHKLPSGVQPSSIEKNKVLEIYNKVLIFLKIVTAKGKIENLLTKNVNISDLKNQTFTVAVQNFFLNDLGLTDDEAAEAFLELKSFDQDVSEYLPEIKTFFRNHYSKMKEGNNLYLKAAIFAFQLSMYAHHASDGVHFHYFMVMNPSNMDAICFNVQKKGGDLFKYLAQAYLDNSDKIEIDIKADGRQGGSSISFLDD